VPNGDFVAAARAQQLLTIPAGDNVVRLLPPLIVTDEEVNEGIERLSRACTELEPPIAQRGAAE
jgi:acetylornithine/N-succinyldiaminopimelate aminotransferase